MSSKTSSFNPLGKIRKFIHGSEHPYEKRDFVAEQMIRDERYIFISLSKAKTEYLRNKSKERILRHNERIRDLDKKITMGVYKINSFQNKF